MKIIIKFLLTAVAVLLASHFVPGIAVASFYTALVVALALAVVNLILKPILIILTLPINILTLGLFTLVINGLLLWLVSTFVRGFEVAGFTPAFLAALIISVVSFVGHKLLSSAEKHD